MTIPFIAVSDTHFGYDRSILNDFSALSNLAESLGDICKHKVNRLILNGDIWEICVPKDVGDDGPVSGITPYTASVSKDFFSILGDYLDVQEVVIIPGNHDYTLWRQATYNNAPDNNKGPCPTFDLRSTRIGRTILASLLGPSSGLYPKVTLAYPTYFLGGQWPYCAFHHGHLLDDLIIGQAADAEYTALSALGVKQRPPVVLDGQETLSSLSLKTDNFLSSLWASNSPARSAMWALIRRDDTRAFCPSVPQEGYSEVQLETFENDLGKNLRWFIDLLTVDSHSPTPIGDKNHPSYLFVGHDHLGGMAEMGGPDGYKWTVINTGGWTQDGEGPPHGHAVVWDNELHAPKVFAIRV